MRRDEVSELKAGWLAQHAVAGARRWSNGGGAGAWVMAAIVGAPAWRDPGGDPPRRRVALATRSAGLRRRLMTAEVKAHGPPAALRLGAQPIFQVFDFERPENVERIILTPRGPFRHMGGAMARVTRPGGGAPELGHGGKISVDSAT